MDDESREKFERFLFEMDDALERLIEDVHGADASCPPLDYSVASVDRLEAWYVAWLKREVKSDAATDAVRTRLARYLGEVVRRCAGGVWDLCTVPRAMFLGMPILSAIPGMPEDYWWCPFEPVDNFRARRPKGLLRRAVELHTRNAPGGG